MKRSILVAALLLLPFTATAQQPRSPKTVAELPPNTIDCSNWHKTEGVQQWVARDPAKPFDFGSKLGWKVDAVESHDFFLSADGVTLYHALTLKCGGG
jgi:hypothetical protein